MTSATRIALAALVFLPFSAMAQSRTAIVVGAGPSYPIGKFRDTQGNGTEFTAGLVRGSDDTPVGLRLDFSYDKLKAKSVGGVMGPERRIAAGTANLVFTLPGFSVKPYFIGGAGGYKVTSKPASPAAKTRFGFDFGAGFTIPLAGRAAFVEARINSISQPKAKPLRYVPLVFGIVF